jgi:predicted Fe-Mo cluster-binding NifX family protein
VDLVMAVEFGPGASSLLAQRNIKKISVRPSTKVADSIKENLAKFKDEQA